MDFTPGRVRRALIETIRQGNRMNANVVDGGKALKILVDDQGVTKGLFTAR